MPQGGQASTFYRVFWSKMPMNSKDQQMQDDTPMEMLKKIDEQQASNERLYAELTSAIPEALPDAIVVIDREGTIRLVNQRTELLFGYSRKELFGQKVELLIPDSVKDAHVTHRDEFWDDPHPRLMGSGRVLSGRDRDGREIKVEIMLSPLVTPHGRFVIAMVRRHQR